MNYFYLILITIVLLGFQPKSIQADYLSDLKIELRKKWPENRTINLVFHGHSVPAGYFKTPAVNTLESYPYLVLKELKSQYPYAVINVINTAIGGENSQSGGQRFEAEVLKHGPDVVFIDYALNDRRIGLESAKMAWEEMIQTALAQNIKVILLTPSPDQSVDLKSANSILDQHSNQIRALSEKYEIGLVDSYGKFKEEVNDGTDLADLMSQGNHPNERGHELIAEKILEYFKSTEK